MRLKKEYAILKNSYLAVVVVLKRDRDGKDAVQETPQENCKVQ